MSEQFETISELYEKKRDISTEIAGLADWNKCWLDNQTNFEEDFGILTITMPFLDADNDYIQIYVTKSENGYLLTDNGYVIQELMRFGFSPNDQRVQKLLDATSKRFEIEYVNRAFCVTTQVADFPMYLKNLTQAIIILHSLSYLIDPLSYQKLKR